MFYTENAVTNRNIDRIVFETMNVLPAQERFLFRKKADATLSTKGNPSDQARVANYLFTSIVNSVKSYNVSKGESAYAYALKTKGDITKMPDWKTTIKCKSYLDDVYKGTNHPYYGATNRLLQMITNCKKDFEYGFRYNIEMITIIYGYLVEAYYEMLDVLAVTAAEYYAAMTPRPIKSQYYNRLIVYTSVNSILDMYENGEWGKFISSLKNPKIAANESFVFGTDEGKLSLINVNEDPFCALEANFEVGKLLSTAGKIGTGIGVIVTIFYGIRALIAYFFKKMSTLKEHLANQASLLDMIVRSDGTLTPEQKAKIEKKRNSYQSLAATIDRKILKANDDAQKDIGTESEKFAKAFTDPTAGDLSVGDPNASADPDFVIL